MSGVYGTDNANWYGGSLSKDCIERCLDKLNGGEISTGKEAAQFQRDADYTLYAIEKGSNYKGIGVNIIPEIKEFMEQEFLQILDKNSYFEYVIIPKTRDEVCKYKKYMKQEEVRLKNKEISFNMFLVVMKSYLKALKELGYENPSYYAEIDETTTIFKDNGYYPPENPKNKLGYLRKVSEFIKSEDSILLIKEKLLESDRKFYDLPIRNKKIWGIGEKAIVLVDDIIYDHDCEHPRGHRGKKEFFNFKNQREEALKLGREILEKYGDI